MFKSTWNIMEYTVNSQEALRSPSKVFMLVEAPLGYLLTFSLTYSLHSSATIPLWKSPTSTPFFLSVSPASRSFL